MLISNALAYKTSSERNDKCQIPFYKILDVLLTRSLSQPNSYCIAVKTLTNMPKQLNQYKLAAYKFVQNCRVVCQQKSLKAIRNDEYRLIKVQKEKVIFMTLIYNCCLSGN